MNKYNYFPTLLYIAIALTVLVSGCSSNSIIDGDVRMNIRTHGDGQIARIYDTFTGFENESLETEMGQTISIDYEATVNEGILIIEWHDPNGAVIWQKILAESESGHENIDIKYPGKHTIAIQGKKASGSFSVSWNLE